MTLRSPAFSDSATWPAAWDRLALELSNLQPGVFGVGDLKVTPAAAGGMRVDIAAGVLAVKGTTGIPVNGVSQGLFVVVNDAPVPNAVTIAASNASLPRIDQIVVRVRDGELSGGGNDATFLTLTGTATSGATLDNRSGAAALPSDHARLADILVPASSAAVTGGNIRDRRGWSRGAFSGRMASGGSNLTLPATGPQALPGDPLVTRIECSGAPVEVTINVAGMFGPTSTTSAYLMVDGAYSTSWIPTTNDPSSREYYSTQTWALDVPAGSHVFNLWMYTISASTTIYCNTNRRPQLIVSEVLKASATSGFDVGARN